MNGDGNDIQEAEPVTAARKPVRWGRVVAVAGSALLAGALVAGVAVTVVTVRDADREAGAPTWKFPRNKAGKKTTTARTGLAGQLVPYGTDGWVRGPDIAQFGSHGQLSGAQATALRKESVSGLPRTVRKQLEREIDRQRIKGMAMRSYFSGQTYAYLQDEGIFSVNVVLARMADKTAVRNSANAQNEFLAALDLYREGPKIKGHDDARCFRLPGTTAADIDRMFCSAYVGDVLVTASAYGAKPLDTAGVAALLRTQLDRIAEPGESV
ncbi:hypothetical protein OG985_24805 [Streptomyces sp. NBC_00289]|uniref:hypothetical protein n=1 Tax=Streptomyces sp. NBC_00289 TaxID=2975703 RepID=UPI00324EAC48